ncbi:tRNA dihydrouridine synthase [Legionella maioricensis]|uniref:tRNA-dihydrouridine synthase n=1 Tax=Legionella maioricensis TaxID=2896528 RepID=A0A9X2I8T3_9GAMM|nr:tRNA-dihydrouridine synthase family protein [Legionella maioricensis]MCL9682954.1 tRNA-dihydrouridine synthase family protein [Legionella maioricensis]MCL9686302.1 tRNA-dihydrouridine synthase family protein [Legionella maioricensis]
MHTFINTPWQIGSLTLPHRLIQGPLAGYSCAPFRELFYQFTPPAFCVTEMSSAIDILHKHMPQSRYLFRSPKEKILAYQISGNDGLIMAQAALLLQNQGADLIDINCGCPKAKIRKKGAGSALLDEPEKLVNIIKKVRETISIPLTVKIRIQGNENDTVLAKKIVEAGADALIVHGRRWMDDYDIECDLHQIAKIKQNIHIPVIANGDISNSVTLKKALEISTCDAFMIARAGSGRPWLYQELLEQQSIKFTPAEQIKLFLQHLEGLAQLEDEFKAVLQSKSLVRYYFKKQLDEPQLAQFYKLRSVEEIKLYLQQARFA